MGLRDDERAQSIQIGAILLFGALIILFAVYQAAVVPNQNQRVEFNHNQRVEGNMLELRNAILGVAQAPDRSGLATVELGTQFPPRLIALNPPSPSGTLSTTNPQPVVVRNASDGDVTGEVCPGGVTSTQAIEYAPSYSAYREAGTIRYENTLLYHAFREGNVTLSDQRLVDGDRILLAPLDGSLLRSSSRSTSVEPTAVRGRTTRVSDPNVTVPTALPNSTWVDLLDGEVQPGNVNVSDGNLTIDPDGTYAVRCVPVGVGESSVSEGTAPAEAGDIKLTNENADEGNDTVNVTFINTAGSNNFTEARLNYYVANRSVNSNPPTSVNISKAGEPVSANLTITGANKTLDPSIELQGGGKTKVVMEFDGGSVEPGDWFFITLELETGEQTLYVVSTRYAGSV